MDGPSGRRYLLAIDMGKGGMMRNQRSGCSGVSLIEVLVVLTIMVLMQALAVPTMSAVVDATRLGSVSQSFFFSLLMARNEAIKRNARVVLCKSATGSACTRAGGWEQGWILFHDVNNNAMVDAGERILQREQALPASVRLTGNTFVESYVSYTPLGHTSLTSGAFQAGTLTLCRASETRSQAKQIVISSSGRARTQKVWVDRCQ